MSFSPAARGRKQEIIISTVTPEMLGVELGVTSGDSFASAIWPATNLAIYLPFVVSEPMTAVKLWCANGSTVSGANNIDMGIYQYDGTAVITKGATAHAGATTIQELDITDTALAPARYFLALWNANTAETFFRGAGTPVAACLNGFGIYQETITTNLSTSAATFAAMAQTYVPLIGLSARTLIV